MDDIEFSNAYAEVLEILKYIPKKDYDKLPKEKIKLYEIFSNKSLKFVYDPRKTLIEQNVSKRASAIIANLYKDYWATPEKKQEIIQKEKLAIAKLEEEKRIKYNPDNLFKKNNIESLENINNTVLPCRIEEKNLFTKILDYIKKIFSKKIDK